MEGVFFGDTNATCQKIERMVRDDGKKYRQEPEEIYAVKGSRKGRSEEEREAEGCMKRKRGGKRQGCTAGMKERGEGKARKTYVDRMVDEDGLEERRKEEAGKEWHSE